MLSSQAFRVATDSRTAMPRRAHRSAAFSRRNGAITIFSALMLVFMLGLVALSVDVGYLLVTRAELQRSADAAALAAGWEMLEQRMQQQYSTTKVRDTVAKFAGLNAVGRQTPTVDLNLANLLTGDLVLGKLVDPLQPLTLLSVLDPSEQNSVRVRVRRSAQYNGEVNLFFGRIFGQQSAAVAAEAQAAFFQEFRGFQIPKGDTKNLPILPFALDETAWLAAQLGIGTDNYSWNSNSERVVGGSDGIPEIHLYPVETGSGGNSGRVDIGGNNTTTPRVRDQIVRGVNQQELDYHGGSLSLNSSGTLTLSADPGLKAGAIESELISIIGQPRIIPLYRSVNGSGNPGQYTIVGFAGVRLVEVKLTSGKKSVRVQPASVIVRGGIPAEPGQGASSHVFSPVFLIQ